MENVQIFLDSECAKRLGEQEFIKPVDEKYAVAGTPATYELWIKNEGGKHIENIAFMELNFKVETEPFDLCPYEKAHVSFTVQVPEHLENAPESQFTIFEVPAGFRNQWKPSADRIQAELSFPERVYEAASTTIPAFFNPIRFEWATASFSTIIKLARKETRTISGNFKFRHATLNEQFSQTLKKFSLEQPKNTHENEGVLVLQYNMEDYFVLNAYLAPTKNDEEREILFQVQRCRLVEITRNRRVYKVELIPDGGAAPFLWRFKRDEASNFQVVMDFLARRFNEKNLLHVKFDDEGRYIFETGLVLP